MEDPLSPHVEHGDTIERESVPMSGITLSPRAAKVTMGNKEESVGAQGLEMTDTMSFVRPYLTAFTSLISVWSSTHSASIHNRKCTSTNSISRSKSIKFAYIQLQFYVASNVSSISSDCSIAAKRCSLTNAKGVLQPPETSRGAKIGTKGEKGDGASSSSSSRGRSEYGRSNVVGVGGICVNIHSWIQYYQESKSGTIPLGSCALQEFGSVNVIGRTWSIG